MMSDFDDNEFYELDCDERVCYIIRRSNDLDEICEIAKCLKENFGEQIRIYRRLGKYELVC